MALAEAGSDGNEASTVEASLFTPSPPATCSCCAATSTSCRCWSTWLGLGLEQPNQGKEQPNQVKLQPNQSSLNQVKAGATLTAGVLERLLPSVQLRRARLKRGELGCELGVGIVQRGLQMAGRVALKDGLKMA